MAVPTLNKLKPYPEFQDLANHINRLVGELNDLLVNLDTLNITRLNAKVIEAGTITAEKMNVTELSAISANLGHITAGLIEAVDIIGSIITGSLIQTVAAGSYPRAYMSNTGASFVVETAPGRAVFIYPGGGVPAIVIQNGSIQTGFDLIGVGPGSIQRILTNAPQLALTATGGVVTINSTDVLAALAGKANVFSGVTGGVNVTDAGGNPMMLHFVNGVFQGTS